VLYCQYKIKPSFPLADTMKVAAVLGRCHSTRLKCVHVITHILLL
jgi:hypothetical protein